MSPSEPQQSPRPRPQLAGMALRNGVLMIGPTSWAVAVRGADGTVRTVARPRPALGEAAAGRVPLLRGPVRLVNMLATLPHLRRVVPEARLAMESRELLAGMAVSSLAVRMLQRRIGVGAASELASGVLSLGITVAAMRGGDVARWHGAEHKSIGGYEQGIPAADAPREHPRCGTQLAIPMLVLSALATQGALLVAPKQPRAARAIGQVLGMAAATELFRSIQTGRGGRLGTAVQRIGITLQRVATTAEPSRLQLDAADAALDRLIEVEGSEAFARPASPRAGVAT